MARKKKSEPVKKVPKKRGRPSKYDFNLCIRIFLALSESRYSLHRVCADNQEFPNGKSVYEWLMLYPELREPYARAREAQADFIRDESTDIADDNTKDTLIIHTKNGPIEVEDKEWTGRSKLRVDHRKWLISKLHPKVYGDKVDVTTGGDKLPAVQNIPLTPEVIKALADGLENKT